MKSHTNTKSHVTKCNTISKRYSICDDVLIYIQGVVILLSLQNHMLKEFHIGHPGITRMKALAKYGYGEISESLQGLCPGSKSTTYKNSTLARD